MGKYLRFSLFVACGLLVALGTVPALAAPARPTTAHGAMRQPAEDQKFTLPDTSSAGPALWSQTVSRLSNGPAAVLAWTGTDPNHSLNIETSTDGEHYGNKVTLDEYSITAPSVLAISPGIVVLAWDGTDPNHSLNVMYDALGARRKLTLRDNSTQPPALAQFNGNIYLAWTGTDLQHLLNVRDMGPLGLTVGPAVTLTQYTSLGGPYIAPDPAHHQLLLTWTDTGNSPYLPADAPFINYLASSNGLSWHLVLVAPPPQTSVAGPSMIALSPAPNSFEPYFWAWTGTDQLHSLNLAASGYYNSYLDPITTFNEQCDGAPALGYVDVLNNHILIAWTGTDPAHHLNVATFIV
jgi:hypothetical protein